MDNKVDKKVESFFLKFKHQSYKKGEILIRADEEPLGTFYLKRGIVRQYSITKDGEEQTLNLFKPKSFFPLMSATTDLPNSYYFEAINGVEVFNAPKKEVLDFLKHEPEVMYDLIQRLYKGMHGLLSRIEYLMSGSAYSKIVFALLNTAYRFGEQKKNSAVEIAITHREIAAITGLTKETISRECTKLEEKGLIENSVHRVLIKDLKKLESELLGA